MMNVHVFMILLVMAIIGICTLTPVNQIHLTMIAHGRKKVLLFECALVIKDVAIIYGIQLNIKWLILEYNLVDRCDDKHPSCAAAAHLCDSIEEIRKDCPKTCGDCPD